VASDHYSLPTKCFVIICALLQEAVGSQTFDLKLECSLLWCDYLRVYTARLPVWSESQHARSQ